MQLVIQKSRMLPWILEAQNTCWLVYWLTCLQSNSKWNHYMLSSYPQYQNSVPREQLLHSEQHHMKVETPKFHNMMQGLLHFLQCQYLLSREHFTSLYLRQNKIHQESFRLDNLPKEKSTIFAPTATADPLEDPPGTRSGAHGFIGVP